MRVDEYGPRSAISMQMFTTSLPRILPMEPWEHPVSLYSVALSRMQFFV